MLSFLCTHSRNFIQPGQEFIPLTRESRDFSGGPGVKTLPSRVGDTVFISERLRSHVPQDQKKKRNRSNVVTNSIKTFKKWSTLKKNLFLKRESFSLFLIYKG